MFDFSISAHIYKQRRKPNRQPRPKVAGLALGALALIFASHVQAQATTQVHDTSPLHPPAGAKVAIVEFEDQECPDCGAANPVLKAAAAKYNIPWVRHDFPLKFHAWSHQAAVYARWFDAKSKKIGDDYRDFIFANQPSIETPAQLTQITGKFAASHGLALPFAVDPQGTLAALVDADYALGERVGIQHTPTIWIVTAGGKAPPYIEVTDRSKLYQIIDAAIAATK
jgi:protein-disulfide isomerase